MQSTRVSERTYPRTEDVGGHTVSIRKMTPADGPLVLDFARSLPEEDKIYLRWDITTEEGVNEWVRNINVGLTTSFLVEEEGNVVAYGSLHHHLLTWTRHQGELRILITPALRGGGLGQMLVKDIYQAAKDLGLKRLVVQIASDQPRVRHMFEEIGFHAEALLTDWVIDRNDRMSDLIIMSMEIDSH